MGKKSKKKTVSSEKKESNAHEEISKEKKSRKLLGKIFNHKKKNAEEKSPDAAVDVENIKQISEPKTSIEKPKEEIQSNPPELQQEKQSESQAKEEVQKTDEKTSIKTVNEKNKTKEEKLDEKKVNGESMLSDGQKQKLKGFLLMLIGILMLAFTGYFLFTKFYRPESIAHFLPAQETVGFAELNFDGTSAQIKKFNQLFTKYPVYQTDNVLKVVNLLTGADYNNDLAPWIGRKVGVVLIKQKIDDNTVKMVLFVEAKSQEKTIEFMKKRVLTNAGDELLSELYNGFAVYHYKQSHNEVFTFINSYLVLSENVALIKQIIDAQKLPGDMLLQNDQFFQKVNNNLPVQNMVSGYVNLQKFYETIVKNPLFQSQKLRDLLQLQPFMKMFAAEGFALVSTGNNITLQTFEAIDRSQLKGESYLVYNDKYDGKLLELAGNSPILFAGGHDLSKELNRISEVFGAGAKVNESLFANILEAQKDKYFGKNISLDGDIYPLLKNEYLVTVENSFQEPVITVMMILENKNEDILRVEKIANAFMQKRAIFSPLVKEVTLPDGTKGQEIVANAQDITRTQNNHQGVNTVTLQLGSLPQSINYAVIDNTFVLSTSQQELNAVIDRKLGKNGANLRVSDEFSTNVLPVMRSADEIFNVKVGALLSVTGLDKNDAVRPYFEPFSNVTMAKNFFDDGISTLYVLGVVQ